MSEQARDTLRKQLRRSRDVLSTTQVQTFSSCICTTLAPMLADHAHVASYLSLGAEVDLSALLAVLSRNDQSCYVPVVLPEHRMAFAPINEHTVITRNRFGISEPQVDASHFRPATDLDAVLVPLVGFDKNCNRMGMGGGYYDRCFAHRLHGQAAPLLIGVAYDMQCVSSVHAQAWDVPLDRVVTERQVYFRK